MDGIVYRTTLYFFLFKMYPYYIASLWSMSRIAQFATITTWAVHVAFEP